MNSTSIKINNFLLFSTTQDSINVFLWIIPWSLTLHHERSKLFFSTGSEVSKNHLWTWVKHKPELTEISLQKSKEIRECFSLTLCLCVIIKLDQRLEGKKIEHINKSMEDHFTSTTHTWESYTRVLLTVSQLKHFFLCLIFLNEILFHAATSFPAT
jgi:hypothetical protein